MPKREKGKQHALVMKILKDFDPAVAKLAVTRYFGKQQLFDGRTHRLRSVFMDESQAREILLGTKLIGDTLKNPKRFSKDEQRLLKSYNAA